MFWLILVVIIIFVIKQNKKNYIKEITKIPPPLDGVRYVKMIYTNLDGSTYLTSIEETCVNYGGRPNEYSIFIDQSLFVDKRFRKSFVLLDENKNQIPMPSNYSFSYYIGDEDRDDAGIIVLYKSIV